MVKSSSAAFLQVPFTYLLEGCLKVSSELSLLHLTTSLCRTGASALCQFLWTSLDSVWHLHIFLVVGSLETNSALQAGSWESGVEVNNQLSLFGVHATFDAAHDIVFLGCRHILLAQVELFISECLQAGRQSEELHHHPLLAFACIFPQFLCMTVKPPFRVHFVLFYKTWKKLRFCLVQNKLWDYK